MFARVIDLRALQTIRSAHAFDIAAQDHRNEAQLLQVSTCICVRARVSSLHRRAANSRAASSERGRARHRATAAASRGHVVAQSHRAAQRVSLTARSHDVRRRRCARRARCTQRRARSQRAPAARRRNTAGRSAHDSKRPYKSSNTSIICVIFV